MNQIHETAQLVTKARDGNKGRSGTAQRLAWIYCNVDPSKIPDGHWCGVDFPVRDIDIAARVARARQEGAVRWECRKLSRWLRDGA
jgi:hypothetical protein